MVDRDDIIVGLEKLKQFLNDLDDEDFEDFAKGYPVCSSFIPHDWRFPANGSFSREVKHLEVRIK